MLTILLILAIPAIAVLATWGDWLISTRDENEDYYNQP